LFVVTEYCVTDGSILSSRIAIEPEAFHFNLYRINGVPPVSTGDVHYKTIAMELYETSERLVGASGMVEAINDADGDRSLIPTMLDALIAKE